MFSSDKPPLDMLQHVIDDILLIDGVKFAFLIDPVRPSLIVVNPFSVDSQTKELLLPIFLKLISASRTAYACMDLDPEFDEFCFWTDTIAGYLYRIQQVFLVVITNLYVKIKDIYSLIHDKLGVLS
ncbi:MAG: hypothetical protein ACFFB5_16755 [Promethearchaeota archaeon]